MQKLALAFSLGRRSRRNTLAGHTMDNKITIEFIRRVFNTSFGDQKNADKKGRAGRRRALDKYGQVHGPTMAMNMQNKWLVT